MPAEEGHQDSSILLEYFQHGNTLDLSAGFESPESPQHSPSGLQDNIPQDLGPRPSFSSQALIFTPGTTSGLQNSSSGIAAPPQSLVASKSLPPA